MSADWMRLVHLVDPSNCYDTGFKVNFFTKKYPEWLPHASLYDILILRDLQVRPLSPSHPCDFFNDVNLDRLLNLTDT